VKWYQAVRIADEVCTFCEYATMLLCTYFAYLVTVTLYKHNIMPQWQGTDCACSTAYWRGRTSCASLLRNCISFVPRCLLHVYHLRPDLSSPSMTSCLPRWVRKCISCVPTCLLRAYLLYPKSSTSRIRVASKNMSVQHVQQFEGSLHSFIIL